MACASSLDAIVPHAKGAKTAKDQCLRGTTRLRRVVCGVPPQTSSNKLFSPKRSATTMTRFVVRTTRPQNSMKGKLIHGRKCYINHHDSFYKTRACGETGANRYAMWWQQ